HSVETERKVSFTGFSNDLSAKYDAQSWQLFGEASHRMQASKLMLEPFAGVSHISLETNGFSESGGSAALTAASTTQNTTFTMLGVRSTFQVLDGLNARGMVGWRHAFGDTNPSTVFAFSGSDPFTVTGAPIAEDAFVTELALESKLSDTAFLAASYNGQYGDGITANGFNLKFRTKF
ncbi:autotransporter domain-containing protein, partial [Pseudovibrio brasiliensis]